MKINEAGIPLYQYNIALNDRNMMFVKRTKENKNLEIGPQSFTLQQMELIFYSYAFMLSLAFLVFLAEIFIGKMKQRNDKRRMWKQLARLRKINEKKKQFPGFRDFQFQ